MCLNDTRGVEAMLHVHMHRNWSNIDMRDAAFGCNKAYLIVHRSTSNLYEAHDSSPVSLSFQDSHFSKLTI